MDRLTCYRYSAAIMQPLLKNNNAACNEYAQLLLRIGKVNESCWSRVRPILCNDAPEGFVFEEVEEDATFGTKDILSWAWRALKEAKCAASNPFGRRG